MEGKTGGRGAGQAEPRPSRGRSRGLRSRGRGQSSHSGRGGQQGCGNCGSKKQERDSLGADVLQPTKVTVAEHRKIEPEREKQSPKHLDNLKQELVALLSDHPDFSIPLSNLSQAYTKFYGKEFHRHGFSKLIDLLMAISAGTFAITEVRSGETRCLELIKPKDAKKSGPEVNKVKSSDTKPTKKPIFVFKSQPAQKPNHSEEDDEDESSEEKSNASSTFMKGLGFDSLPDLELPEDFGTEEEEGNEKKRKTNDERLEIAIFWDIENCPVPRGVRTSTFVQRVRQQFCSGHKELEFLAINNGQNRRLNCELHELNIETSLSVVDKKNSADDILKEKMKNFVEKREGLRPCKLLLISGDVDFSRELTRFRYKYKYETVLLHNKQAKDTLKSVVNEAIDLQSMFPELRITKKAQHKPDVEKLKSKSQANAVDEVQQSMTIVANFVSTDITLAKASDFLQLLCQMASTSLGTTCLYNKQSLRQEETKSSGVVYSAVVKVSCDGEEKIEAVKEFMKQKSDSEIKISCSSSASLSKNQIDNSVLAENACLSLEAKIKGALTAHQLKIGEVESKQRAALEALEVLTETKQSASQALTKSQESASLQKMLETYDKELKDFYDQKEEFDQSTSCLLGKIKDLKIDLDKSHFERAVSDVRTNFGKELFAFEEGLPIYRYRRRVQTAVTDNAVTIIMAETGSGKSSQVAQYLVNTLPSSKMIVCTQPRKIAAVSLASHVARQMGTSVGGVVGYKVGSQLKMSKQTRILFMTDQMLLNECTRDRTFSKYSCVILDEVHERSINTDLLLGLTKEGIISNRELKVVITSATMDSEMFFRHYSGDGVQVAKLDIPGRTFPIDIKWETCSVDLSRTYLQSVQNKTEEILRKTIKGDILVFVATPADTDTLCERLNSKVNDIDVYQLHGRLQVEDQRKIFEAGAKRRVIFSTNCAETSVTVPGIKYVIDSGVAKEMKYNPLQNSSSLEIQKINQSSAKQRAGRAGRTEPGVCYRMYSQKEHESMSPDMIPDIKKVGLGQTVLKIIDFGIQEPHSFSFIESPGRENIQHTLKNLESLGAVEIREGRAHLTELGRKMAKLPLEPRLSKLVLLCIKEDLGEEGVRLASLVSVSGNVFFRIGSEEQLLQADQKKIAFCKDEGDFLTLLKVYDMWSQVDEKKKSKWCVENYINGKSMKIARDTARDIKMSLKHDCKIDIASSNTLDDRENRLLRLIFQCFKDNLCLYGGHHKLGYINILTKEAFPLHPSSTYHYLGATSPTLVVYDRLLTTSRTFLLGVSRVEASMLSPEQLAKVEEAAEGIVTQESISPLGPRIMRQNLLGQKGKGLKQIEAEVREALPKEHFLDLKCSFEGGSLTWVSKPLHHPLIKECIVSRLGPFHEKLRQESLKTNAQYGSDHTTAVIGAEGKLKDVVLYNEFADIMIEKDQLEVLDMAKQLPGVYQSFQTKRKTWVVSFDSVALAKEALGRLERTGGRKSCHPLMRSTPTKNAPGFEIKVTFRRRRLKDFAFLKFDSEEDCHAASMKLGGRLFVGPRQECVTVKPNKKDRVSLFLALSIRGFGPLDFIRTAEKPNEMIEDAVKNLGISFKEVFIPMDPPVDSTNEDIENIQDSLRGEIQDAGIESKDYGIHIRQRKPRDFFWVARLTFSSFSLGLAVATHLKQRRYIIWTEDKGAQRFERMVVEHQMTTSFSCCRRVFDAVRESVEASIKEVSALCQTDSLELKINEFGADRAVFVINCSDLKTMAMANDALQDLMKGDRLDHPNVKLLLTPGNQAGLRRIEEESGAYLERSLVDGALTIFGSVSQANKAKTQINALLSKIIDDGHNTSLESLDKYPKGLVSAMLKEFGVDLERLHEKDGVYDVKFLVPQRKLRIIASPGGLQQVRTELEKISKQLPEVDCLKEEECCPVCLSTPEDGRRLEHCGHIYCSSCLTLQILSSSGPLLCVQEGCSSPLVVEDFKPFHSNEKVMKKIVRRAVEQRLLGPDSSLLACPSPNCEGVFRRCKSVFHNGMTCQFYQLIQADDNHSLRVWLAEKPEERKLCTGCQAPIEKAGGCLHVHCAKCGAHMCWNCMEVFPTGSQVYNHTCRARRAF